MAKEKIEIPIEPSAEDFKAARARANLTQKEASVMVFSPAESHRTVQNWETGVRQIPRGTYILFLLMTGQLTLAEAKREARLLK